MFVPLIILTGLIQIIVSLSVLLRDRRNLSYRLFFLIGITTLAWSITNALSLTFLHTSFFAYLVRGVMFFVVLQNALFYMFGRVFPGDHWKYSRRRLLVYWLCTLAVALLTQTSLVFSSVSIQGDLPMTQPGPMILAFLAHAFFSIIVSFRALLRKKRKAVGVQKTQLQLLLAASTLIWVVVPITNFGLTMLLKTTVFIVWSPFYTLAFASLIAYAMITQKLFDIRFYAVRAVTYLFTMAMVTLLYLAPAIYIVAHLFNVPLSLADFLVLLPVCLLLTVSYGYLRAYIDRLTSQLFFRGAYDAEQFIAELNRAIVTNLNLENLLKSASDVIARNFKADYCEFSLSTTHPSLNRPDGIRFSYEEQVSLHRAFQRQDARVLVADALPEEFHAIRRALSRHGVAVIASIATPEVGTDALGYIMLGTKKSGQQYNVRDVRTLTTIIDGMIVAIQNALRFEEIQNFNESLQYRISVATHKLQLTNEKLKALDETKDEFISMASHQLRTPLTAVKGYLSMVLEGDAGKLNRNQRKLLEQSYLSSQRMVYLISDLLNLSRLNTGKFIIEPTQVNLAEVVQLEIDQLEETARAREVSLRYDKPTDFPEMSLDETKIHQVVMNFIDNAIYYTPAHGKVEITLHDLPGSVEFRVKDNGIGVPREEQHHLFTKFYRADNAKRARPDGTGLGLFMAKKVIAAQGGAIIFDSQEGKGSTFGFRFNKAQHTVPRHEPTAVATSA